MSATSYPNYTREELVELALAIQTDVSTAVQLLSAIEEILLIGGIDLSALIKAQLPLIRLITQGALLYLPEGAATKIAEVCDTFEGLERIRLIDCYTHLIKLYAEILPEAASLQGLIDELESEGEPSAVSDIFKLLLGPYAQFKQLLTALTALQASLDRVIQSQPEVSAEIQQEFIAMLHTQLLPIVRVNQGVFQLLTPMTVEQPNPVQHSLLSILEQVGVPADQVQALINTVATETMIKTQGTMMPYVVALDVLIKALESKQHLLKPYLACSRASRAVQTAVGVDQMISELREATQKMTARGDAEPQAATAKPQVTKSTHVADLYQDTINFATLCSDAEKKLPSPTEQTQAAQSTHQRQIYAVVSTRTGLSIESCERFGNLRKLFKAPFFNRALRILGRVTTENIEMAFACHHLLKDDPTLQDATPEVQGEKIQETLEQLARIAPGYWGWEQDSAMRARLQQIEMQLKTEPDASPEYLTRVTNALKKLDALDKLVAHLCVEVTAEHRALLSELAVTIRATRQSAPAMVVVRQATSSSQTPETSLTAAPNDAEDTPTAKPVYK